MDVDALMARTPSHVFEEWKSFHKMQRWGEDWDQTAQLTAVQCGSNKPTSTFRPTYTPPVIAGDNSKSIERTNALLSTVLAINQARAASGRR